MEVIPEVSPQSHQRRQERAGSFRCVWPVQSRNLDLYRPDLQYPEGAARIPERPDALRPAVAAQKFRVRASPAQRTGRTAKATGAAVSTSLQSESELGRRVLARIGSFPDFSSEPFLLTSTHLPLFSLWPGDTQPGHFFRTGGDRGLVIERA